VQFTKHYILDVVVS